MHGPEVLFIMEKGNIYLMLIWYYRTSPSSCLFFISTWEMYSEYLVRVYKLRPHLFLLWIFLLIITILTLVQVQKKFCGASLKNRARKWILLNLLKKYLASLNFLRYSFQLNINIISYDVITNSDYTWLFFHLSRFTS